MDKIEEKLEEISKEGNITIFNSNIRENIVKNKTNVKKIESEIQELKEKQVQNFENIRLISENIVSLEQSHEAQKKSDHSNYKCRQCEAKFTTEVCLKSHINHKHSTQYHCEICRNEFEGNVTLEQHMITIHKAEKKFKCDKCETAFVVEWRLRKHKKIHLKTNIRKCHYYNNMKECPFSTLGCKFLHEKSSFCKYNENCNLEKCQFQHSETSNNY